ncbi:Fibroblast growth factor receptor 1 [Taenia crassiceps]|uniref:Fibroblast growth factor receptor 1 n=1 Tax=Taenia crassiceps TaxID=6207 RepID=A0ABR4QI02_9CEST
MAVPPMCGGRILLLLSVFHSHIASQHSPPFHLNGLVFNISTRVAEGAEVGLHCEYLVHPQPHCAFTMLISFVEEASLTKAQVEMAASTQFLFPDDLREAHEKGGKVLNRTIYALEMTDVASVIITNRFSMSSEHAGSYICQMVPLNATSTEAWTLTKWMRLEVYRGMASAVELLWSMTVCLGVLVCVVVMGCYCTCRRRCRRLVLKRVLIERSASYVGGAVMPPEGYRCAKVSLLRETRPSLRVYMKALYEQRELERLCGMEGVCEGAGGVKRRREREEVGGRVRYLMPIDAAYDVAFSGVRVERRLGEGAFGLVFRGSAMHLPGGISGSLTVAIKTLRADSSEADVVAFVQEMEMMKFIGKHENVIELYATSSYNGRPVVIMEYAAEGSLVDYLRRNRSCLANQLGAMRESVLLRFALQVANGMAYLASKGIVHRDLAARNVVVTKDLVAKVSDFGLTRKAELYYRMRGTGRVPLKWMAPECVFHKVFTTKSDVWSFGVLLWEVFSLGDAPAAAVSTNDFLKLLHAGASLYTKPKYADERVFVGLMQHCWEWRPECRPTFMDVVAALSKLLEESQCNPFAVCLQRKKVEAWNVALGSRAWESFVLASPQSVGCRGTARDLGCSWSNLELMLGSSEQVFEGRESGKVGGRGERRVVRWCQCYDSAEVTVSSKSDECCQRSYVATCSQGEDQPTCASSCGLSCSTT